MKRDTEWDWVYRLTNKQIIWGVILRMLSFVGTIVLIACVISLI